MRPIALAVFLFMAVMVASQEMGYAQIEKEGSHVVLRAFKVMAIPQVIQTTDGMAIVRRPVVGYLRRSFDVDEPDTDHFYEDEPAVGAGIDIPADRDVMPVEEDILLSSGDDSSQCDALLGKSVCHRMDIFYKWLLTFIKRS